jgi:hypothetical protein
MKYFNVGLGIPGTYGENTIYDYSTRPPTIVKAHFELDDEPEAVFTKVHNYFASAKAKSVLLENGVSGIVFDEVEISVEPEFAAHFREVKKDEFFWMKVEGEAYVDDFGIVHGSAGLVVSERALKLLQELGIPTATISLVRE